MCYIFKCAAPTVSVCVCLPRAVAMMTEEELESIRKIGMEDWKSDPIPTSEANREERPHISALLKAKRAINECVMTYTCTPIVSTRDTSPLHFSVCCPVCREKLVDFQSRVSRPLLARYFYSCKYKWLCCALEQLTHVTAVVVVCVCTVQGCPTVVTCPRHDIVYHTW